MLQDRLLGAVLILLGCAGIGWFFLVVPGLTNGHANLVLPMLAVVGIVAGILVRSRRTLGLWLGALFFGLQVPKYIAQDFAFNLTLGLNLNVLLQYTSRPDPFAVGVDCLALGLLAWTAVRIAHKQPHEVALEG